MRLSLARYGVKWTWLAQAVAFCCLAATTPVQAKDVKGWTVEPLESGEKCVMSSVFEDGVMLTIFWNPRDESTVIAVGSESWNSLASRKGQTVKITYSLAGNVEYDEWWDNEAFILSTDTGMEAIAATWSREHSLDLAVSFGLATSVTIESDGRTIGSYKLSGSYDAILELRKCGSRLLSKGGDPFAN